MRAPHTYRSERKRIAKEQGIDRSTMTWDVDPEVGPGRRAKWLMRHPKIALFYSAAVSMLQENERAQKPSWRAVRKMMVVLATAPYVPMPGIKGGIPYPMASARHARPTWRQYKRQAIDANLQVTHAQ